MLIRNLDNNERIDIPSENIVRMLRDVYNKRLPAIHGNNLIIPLSKNSLIFNDSDYPPEIKALLAHIYIKFNSEKHTKYINALKTIRRIENEK